MKGTPQLRAQFLEMLTGFRRFQLASLAVEIGVPQHLARAPLTLNALAEATGYGGERLHRVLRGMIWANLLKTDANDAYSLTELGELLIATGPQTISSFMLINSQIYYRGWGDLLSFLKSGVVPFEHVSGAPVFEHMNGNPALRELFHGVMTSATAADADGIVAGYVFPEHGRIVDVGGGYGQLVVRILLNRPELEGVVFDLPALRDDAERYISQSGLQGRCCFREGSIFDGVELSEPADVYLLKWILHDWDAEASKRILRNCARSMTKQARLLIIERLMPGQIGPGEDMVQRDLNMLVLNGGQERTLKEYGSLIQSADLVLDKVSTLPNGFTIIEAVKPKPPTSGSGLA